MCNMHRKETTMAANIDSMLFVGAKPWHGLGVDMTDNPPESAEEIIKGAGLGWSVEFTPMLTAIHERVPNYNAIYRTDNSEILGVINKSRPILVQNEDMFCAVDSMINRTVDVETAASLGRGENVFGCFRIREQYKLIDDDMEQYFVVVNDHIRADGRVMVLNTPIRVVCQNTLSAALNQNLYKIRIPVSPEASVNNTLSTNLLYAVKDSIDAIKKRAEEMLGKKIDKVYVERLLDMLFPYQTMQGEPVVSLANERMSMLRSQFLSDCMDADNLQNYKGTQWQVFNAVTDWNDHYFKNADRAYDLTYRMNKVFQLNPAAEANAVSKYMKVADKLAA